MCLGLLHLGRLQLLHWTRKQASGPSMGWIYFTDMPQAWHVLAKGQNPNRHSVNNDMRSLLRHFFFKSRHWNNSLDIVKNTLLHDLTFSFLFSLTLMQLSVGIERGFHILELSGSGFNFSSWLVRLEFILFIFGNVEKQETWNMRKRDRYWSWLYCSVYIICTLNIGPLRHPLIINGNKLLDDSVLSSWNLTGQEPWAVRLTFWLTFDLLYLLYCGCMCVYFSCVCENQEWILNTGTFSFVIDWYTLKNFDHYRQTMWNLNLNMEIKTQILIIGNFP